MKTFKTFAMFPLIVALLLAIAPVGATVTYDSAKSVNRNQVDALIAIANAAIPLLNDILFVDGDRTDDYTADGSLAHPYKTIAAAIAASASGDALLVAPGAYSETVSLTAGTMLFGWNVTGATITGEYVLFNYSGNKFSSFFDYDIATAATQSFSIAASSRASRYISTYSGTGASTVHLMTDLVASGRELIIVDGGGNSDPNNIVLDTEGSETINGGATFTIATDYRQIRCISNGTNWLCY